MSASVLSSSRADISMTVTTIIAMSAVINVLSLGGAIYMLQVYDRVLSSQSVPTLVVLSVLLATAYLGLGLLDALRAQLMSRLGSRLDAQLAVRAFSAVLESAPSGGRRSINNQHLRDLEVLRGFLLGAAPHALIDLPWTPLFLLFVAALDPILGGVTLAAIVLVFVVGRLAQSAANRFENETSEALRNRRMLADAAANCSDLVQTTGLGPALAERHQRSELVWARSIQRTGDRATWFSSTAKVLRLTVHSALIGVGAYVAIRGDLTLGAIVAATIAAGRALAQVESVTAHGQTISKGFAAWRRLSALRVVKPPTPGVNAMGHGELAIQGLSYVIPGRSQPVLRGISLVLKPGSALAILGKMGAGKSLLTDAMVGLIVPTVGTVRLAGTPVWQLSDAERRLSIGYAPQREQWLPGDITDAITGFRSCDARSGAIETAQAVGLHPAICELANGYATPIEEALCVFSNGQRRQLALARAFHGTPRLIVLDEPFAELDAEGEAAVSRMIWAARQRGAIVVLTSKRRLAKSAIGSTVIIEGGTFKPGSVTTSTALHPPDEEQVNDQSASVVTLPRRMS